MSDSISESDLSNVDSRWIEDVATGGAVLGGGGGGSLTEGLSFGELAIEYGTPEITTLNALPEDGFIITVSAVGAPAATDQFVKPHDYVRAFKLIRDRLTTSDKTVCGVMTNEMGGFASINGLLQSAVTGIPVIDAACNGRAHPTGPMGSMGLPSSEECLQAAAGGDPDVENAIEAVIEAPLSVAADSVRSIAEKAGGIVAVARNPVTVAYANEHAAIDLYDQARSIGATIRKANSGAPERIAQDLDGTVPIKGEVESVELRTEGGFDVGEIRLNDAEITFWNEYMTVEYEGERLATFPDLIATLNSDTGAPITTADIQEGMSVTVLTAPSESLSLGAGMNQKTLFEPIEEMIDKSIIQHSFD